MTHQETLLAAIVADPGDSFAWIALADCLEEQGKEQEAELVRLRETLRKAVPKEIQRSHLEERLQLLLSQGVEPIGPRWEVELTSGVSSCFHLIPPGIFWMGSPRREPRRRRNEGPRHLVRLSRGFWIGRTPLTVHQWQTLTGGRRERGNGERPAWGMSWLQIIDVCRDLRQRTKLLFRLPTEAEWEYSCRATTWSSFCLGSTDEAAQQVGWHRGSKRRLRHPVARKRPNAWGLYDVHGSVWEWCLDGRRTYTARVQHDPIHQLHENTSRVLRGGSIDNYSEDARSACRGWAEPGDSAPHWGARLVIALEDNESVARLFGRS